MSQLQSIKENNGDEGSYRLSLPSDVRERYDIKTSVICILYRSIYNIKAFKPCEFSRDRMARPEVTYIDVYNHLVCSREESSKDGVASRVERACGQTPAMEEGTGVNPGCSPGCSVLNSPSLRSLVGVECLQILRCSICMEFFNIPIVLPCGHTFCLQCLTEMCKHATRPRGKSSPVTEVLIGCPNCRVQIFAMPILQRNVTCNFIIQSLVDMLRNRKVPEKKDVSANTERSLIGPPVRAVSEDALCGVIQDLDRLSNSLEHRSVVDDAFFEIEAIRRIHLSNADHGASGVILGATTESAHPAHCVNRPTMSEPDSSTTGKADSTHQLEQIQELNLQNPKRCYAAALTAGKEKSGKDKPATTFIDSAAAIAKSARLPCSSRLLPISSSRTLPVTPAAQNLQNSSGGFRNKNRNNREAVSFAAGSLEEDRETVPCREDFMLMVSDPGSLVRRFETSRKVETESVKCDRMKSAIEQKVLKFETMQNIFMTKCFISD